VAEPVRLLAGSPPIDDLPRMQIDRCDGVGIRIRDEHPRQRRHDENADRHRALRRRIRLHLDAPHLATARSVEDRDVTRLRVRDEHVLAVAGELRSDRERLRVEGRDCLVLRSMTDTEPEPMLATNARSCVGASATMCEPF
jgi:hypothetical protein